MFPLGLLFMGPFSVLLRQDGPGIFGHPRLTMQSSSRKSTLNVLLLDKLKTIFLSLEEVCWYRNERSLHWTPLSTTLSLAPTPQTPDYWSPDILI